MRYAVILAGGSGTRLWPMSRLETPKQLIPFMGGRSLLQLAFDRLEGLVPTERRFICAGETHRRAITEALPALPDHNYLGEPVGRDTLNAVGLSCAILAERDPEAIVAFLTADHLIQPDDAFRGLLGRAMDLAERQPETLITFGVKPTEAATGFGYLQLGASLDGDIRRVDRFREKPDAETAVAFFEAGPERYLWNSGMFVWSAATALHRIAAYQPEARQGLAAIAAEWAGAGRTELLDRVYPQLPRVSIDYALMEPASRDSAVTVAAVPMDLDWLDVGSWPAWARTQPTDAADNVVAAPAAVLVDCARSAVVSNDPHHAIALVGCEDLIVVHTPGATLVCRASSAEAVKEAQRRVKEELGDRFA